MGTYIRIYLISVIIGAVLGYRLPENVIPSEYKLEIITNLADESNKLNFSGKVWIEVTCTSPTRNITLHSKNLHIDKKNVHVRPLHKKEEKEIEVTELDFSKNENDFLIIHLSDTLKDGHKYILEIWFSANLEENLEGYYKSYYTDKQTNKKKWLAVTQFEPSDARRAFPCFDEPGMKAKFTISLGRHKKYSSISNMPIRVTEDIKDKPDWVWDRYETSVPMSTYLAAYAVTDFGYEVAPKFENNVTFRIWSRKDALNQIHFAKDVGPKFLRFFEKYFDIAYPLPKQDMIAVPDFASGAMENWGLITYRETYLLVDDKQTPLLSKVNVAEVIAHELAHQWFGNLVTMKWWTDLWLNEGFATYMAAVAVEHVFPKWQHLQRENADNILAVFSFDSLKHSHPVSVPIGHPKEISEIFDTISYKKGSYLLHMMANFLSEETFRHGVSNYLKLHKYSNADKDDLWKSMTEEAHKRRTLPENLTVKKVMDNWALQTGYPLITVKRNYGDGTLEVQQNRFVRDRKKFHSYTTKWWVPLSYTTESQLKFNTTKPKLWLSPSKNVTVIDGFPNDNDWVIFNIKASGLYRVNYDEKNWNLLIDALKSSNFRKIPTLNRVLLIDNAANLAWIGQLDYKIFFDIIGYLEQERDFLPWRAAFRAVGNLDTLLKRTSVYGEFREYMKKIIKPIYDNIGGFEKIDEEDNSIYTIEHKVQVTRAACRYNVEHCVSDAIKLFKNMHTNSSTGQEIPKDLRSIVYCVAVKYGGEEEWRILWNMYLKSNVASVKYVVLKALGCTQQSWLLQLYLEWAIENNSGIRKQDVASVFDAVISNDIGFFVGKQFIQQNIKKIFNRLKPTTGKLNSIISSLSMNMIDTSEYEWLKNFTKSRQEYFREIKNGVNQALETSLLNTQWHEANWKDIRQHLREYKI